MKTLDEVIDELEDEGLFADALHYLKHLQDYYEISANGGLLTPEPRSVEIGSGVGIKWHEPNPPLTWDELRQMEGKPVWVEYDDHFPGRKGTKFKEWEVIDVIFDDRLVAKGEWDYHKNEMGHVWQAYRKERS
jgi:hypothetical protein